MALAVALNNPVQDLPRMGAVICDSRGYVWGQGMNTRKSDPLAAKYGRHPDAIYPHAELNAIKTALWRYKGINLSEMTLYVARVKKDGTPALAKPCTGCQRAIMEFGIGNVEWTV